jgi:hypothetical protein
MKLFLFASETTLISASAQLSFPCTLLANLVHIIISTKLRVGNMSWYSTVKANVPSEYCSSRSQFPAHTTPLNSPEPPEVTLLAFFLRYPNPFARHVLSVDVIGRHVDPLTGNLHTQRLILKRGILPKWATRWLPVAGMSGGRGLDAWVLEESVVYAGNGEGSTPRLKCKQGNLNHRKIMHVVEGAEIYGGNNG